MQPWKISIGFTVIIIAVVALIAGEQFAYLEPHFQTIFTHHWMPLAWRDGGGGTSELAQKLGQEERGEFPG